MKVRELLILLDDKYIGTTNEVMAAIGTKNKSLFVRHANGDLNNFYLGHKLKLIGERHYRRIIHITKDGKVIGKGSYKAVADYFKFDVDYVIQVVIKHRKIITPDDQIYYLVKTNDISTKDTFIKGFEKDKYMYLAPVAHLGSEKCR